MSVTNERLDKTLEKIATAGHFQFSYNTGIVKIDSAVSITVSDKTVKEVLDNLLGKKIMYVENGNYLILKKSNPAPETITVKPHKASYIITGYVVNKATGEKVNEASVYDKISLSS
ncbi:MAG TPA: STN domain-containing protein, partial [Bacteroidia bacterium]|nr:STN domain-containing protein [Bacteroidia bacterium]